MKKIYFYIILLTTGIFILSSCSESLDTEPSGRVSKGLIEELAASDPAALALVIEPQIAGMYGQLVAYDTYGGDNQDDYGISSYLHIADMMGEDVVQTSGSYGWYWSDYNLLLNSNEYRHPAQVWVYFYRLVKLGNDILAQIPATVEANTALAAYRGQALTMRAFAYHYLVQYFQKTYVGHESDMAVPLVTEVAKDKNPRATMTEVYAQMIADLNEAIILLDGYTAPTKAMFNKNIAHGILARVYLNMENWALAETEAHAARQGYALMTGEMYLDGFKNLDNVEWMFGSIVTMELDIVKTGICNFPSFMSSFSYGYAGITSMFKAIDKRLYDHMNPTDIRKKAFQAPDLSTFPNGGYKAVKLPAYVNGKFGASDDGADNTQDLVYMRAGEMYLIEAEALAAQNKTSEAASLLNEFVKTRDASFVAPTDKVSLLSEIRIQRRIDLWGEIGNALFDVKRLKLGINRAYTGSNHPVDAQLVVPAEAWKFTYQLPKSEVDNNPDISEEDNNPLE